MTGIIGPSHNYPSLFVRSAERLWEARWGQEVRIGECVQCSGLRVIRYPDSILLLHLYVYAAVDVPHVRDRLIAYLEACPGRAHSPWNIEERYPWPRPIPVW